MKLFSNFDTRIKYKIHKHYQKMFWEKNVLLVQKSRLFWFLYVFLPFIWYLLSETLVVILAIYFVSHIYITYFIIWFSFLIFLIFVFPIIKNYLAYSMDFMIITPKEIIKYDQEWFFERDVKTINTSNIKAIIIRKKWFLNSIFNNWDMTFLSEWSTEDMSGEIVFHDVYDPEWIKTKISNIIDLT